MAVIVVSPPRTSFDGAGEELRRRVVEKVGAVLEQAHQPRHREGRVDQGYALENTSLRNLQAAAAYSVL
jgi:hypothetical protein